MSNFSLSPKEINHAIREVEKSKRDSKQAINKLISALTDQGIEMAKLEIQELNAFYAEELESSITGHFSPSTGMGIIKASTPFAFYVEFGTGIAGTNSSHAAPNRREQNIPSHGEADWQYYDHSERKIHWTKEMPSRPFHV